MPPVTRNLSLRRIELHSGVYYRVAIGPPEGCIGETVAVDFEPEGLRKIAAMFIDTLYRFKIADENVKANLIKDPNAPNSQ